jgi:hypothetical protein
VTRERAFTAIRCTLFWLCLALLGYWAVDDDPPYSVGTYTATNGRPGDRVNVVAKVHRDIERECSVDVRRYIIDASGAELESRRMRLGPDEVRARDALMHDQAVFSSVLPMMAAPGPALHVMDFSWQCNPLHLIFPVHLRVQYQFEILKP